MDQAVEDFEVGLVSALTDAVDRPELDASFDGVDAMPSSVSLGLLCLVSIASHNSILQLAPSIKSHKLWCQARALLLPVPQAGQMSASRLIYYFAVIQLHLNSRHLCYLILSF